MNAFKLTSLFTLIFLIPTSLSLASGLPNPRVAYTADSSLELDHITIDSKVFYSPGMLRREEDVGGLKRVFIMRDDLKRAWILLPDDKTYFELNSYQAKRVKNDLLDSLRDKSLIGAEEIDGVKIKKYEIVAIQPDGTKFDGLMWLTDKGIPIKVEATEMETGFAVPYKRELKNLKIKKIKRSLFEVPADYAPIAQEKQKKLLVREVMRQMTMR